MDRCPVSSNIVPSDFQLLAYHFKKHRTQKTLQQILYRMDHIKIFATNAYTKQGDVILTTDSRHRFLLRWDKVLLPQCDRCLNVISNYAEVWCVPSATHVSCIHRRQNEVLGVRNTTPVFPLKFSKYIYIFGSPSKPIFQRYPLDRSFR